MLNEVYTEKVDATKEFIITKHLLFKVYISFSRTVVSNFALGLTEPSKVMNSL